MAKEADFTAPEGGVKTDDVGSVTGDLTLVTTAGDGGTEVRVKYRDAADEYTVSGSPLEGDHDATAVAQWLSQREGATDSLGNAEPVDLNDFA